MGASENATEVPVRESVLIYSPRLLCPGWQREAVSIDRSVRLKLYPKKGGAMKIGVIAAGDLS
jgi:hypothetical protein